MFGRAGRRGLDNEGHIVFVNVNIEEIMKGQLSQIVGNHPETPAIATYHQISPFVNHQKMEKSFFQKNGKSVGNRNSSESIILYFHLRLHRLIVEFATPRRASTG